VTRGSETEGGRKSKATPYKPDFAFGVNLKLRFRERDWLCLAAVMGA
jgi:hypothetical protein